MPSPELKVTEKLNEAFVITPLLELQLVLMLEEFACANCDP